MMPRDKQIPQPINDSPENLFDCKTDMSDNQSSILSSSDDLCSDVQVMT